MLLYEIVFIIMFICHYIFVFFFCCPFVFLDFNVCKAPQFFLIGCGAILNKNYYYYRSKVRILLMGIYKMLLVYLDIATTNITQRL